VTLIRLAIADDHPAIGLALRAALAADASNPPIELVADVRTLDAALALVTGGRDGAAVDVLLCDLQLEGDVEGLRVIEAAAASPSAPRVVAFTSFERSTFMRAVFDAGGAGFLPKSAEMPEVLKAVRDVAGGRVAFSGAALDAIRQAPRGPSAREVEIVRRLAGGATTDEIAHALDVSPRTVESHVRRLFDRYGVVSRAELTALATREGWVADTR
jgi:DNA-binding NarL/FixJ family response regulator